MKTEAYVTADELSFKFGVPAAFLREQARLGKLRALKVGKTAFRFKEEEVRQFLSKEHAGAEPQGAA